jgi:hypothetical protein
VTPTLLVLLLAAGAVGGLALVAALRRAPQRRTEALGAAAERMGWGFRETVPFKTIPDLDRFELFRQGHSKKLRNLLTSPPGEPRAVVFDYAYTTGAGKSQATHHQTVFYATGERLALPVFSLRPEHFFHRVAGIFGYQDIDLERRPVFSRAFLLRGEDEAAVRTAFTDPVVDFFEQKTRVCAAGTAHELLYWLPGRRLPPEELETFVAEGFELAGRFQRGGATGPGSREP